MNIEGFGGLVERAAMIRGQFFFSCLFRGLSFAYRLVANYIP